MNDRSLLAAIGKQGLRVQGRRAQVGLLCRQWRGCVRFC